MLTLLTWCDVAVVDKCSSTKSSSKRKFNIMYADLYKFPN